MNPQTLAMLLTAIQFASSIGQQIADAAAAGNNDLSAEQKQQIAATSESLNQQWQDMLEKA